MKSITKLSITAAFIAVITTAPALADNQQHQNQLAMQREQNARAEQATTIAVYAHDRGVGQVVTQSTPYETRFEMRTNAQGQTYGAYVHVK